MSIGEEIKAIVPPRFHRDVSIVIVAGALAWGLLAFNDRLSAAEKKANTIESVQENIARIETDQASMKQEVKDTDANVQTLVSVMIGQSAVVHHPSPRPPPP